MFKRYMGLDVSSTTIGFSIISADYENIKFTLECVEYYKPLKEGTIFEKLLKCREWILNKLDEHIVDDVVIEEISEYMQGNSNSKTIIALALFNRTIGTAVLDRTGKNPIMMNVNTIRSILRPSGYDGKLKKEDVPEVIAKVLNIDFPYILDKNGKHKPESYDMADSIAVPLAYSLLEISKSQKDKKTCKSKKRIKH